MSKRGRARARSCPLLGGGGAIGEDSARTAGARTPRRNGILAGKWAPFGFRTRALHLARWARALARLAAYVALDGSGTLRLQKERATDARAAAGPGGEGRGPSVPFMRRTPTARTQPWTHCGGPASIGPNSGWLGWVDASCVAAGASSRPRGDPPAAAACPTTWMIGGVTMPRPLPLALTHTQTHTLHHHTTQRAHKQIPLLFVHPFCERRTAGSRCENWTTPAASSSKAAAAAKPFFPPEEKGGAGCLHTWVLPLVQRRFMPARSVLNELKVSRLAPCGVGCVRRRQGGDLT